MISQVLLCLSYRLPDGIPVLGISCQLGTLLSRGVTPIEAQQHKIGGACLQRSVARAHAQDVDLTFVELKFVRLKCSCLRGEKLANEWHP